MLARLMLSLALALACGSDCRAVPNDIDLPGEFAVTPVAQRVILNGLPLEVAALSAPLAPQQACALVSGQWSRIRPAGVMGCRWSGDWLLVSRRSGTRIQAVQFREAPGGLIGFVSQLDLRAPLARPLAPRLPLPTGTRVVSALQSAGPEGESREFTLLVPLPPAAALRWLRASASRLGWPSTRPDTQMPGEGLLEFGRGSERIQAMVVRSDQGSGVVLVEQILARRRP